MPIGWSLKRVDKSKDYRSKIKLKFDFSIPYLFIFITLYLSKFIVFSKSFEKPNSSSSRVILLIN